MKSLPFALLILISGFSSASAQNLTGYLLNIGTNNLSGGSNAIIGQDNNLRVPASWTYVYAYRSLVVGMGNTTVAEDSIIAGKYNSTDYNEEMDGDTLSSAVFGMWNSVAADHSLVVGSSNAIARTYLGEGGSADWQKPKNSAVLGYGLINRFSNCTIVGKNNVSEFPTAPHSGPAPLFIVANGPSASNRSNAVEVLDNGDMDVQGNIEAGGVITCAPGGDIPMFTGN